MSIPGKWRYVYWFAVFSLLSIIIVFFQLFERSDTVDVVVVFTILCLSLLLTYFYKKIPWKLPFVYWIEGGKQVYDRG